MAKQIEIISSFFDTVKTNDNSYDAWKNDIMNDPILIQNVPRNIIDDELCYIALDKTKGNLSIIPEYARSDKVCLDALALNPKCNMYLINKNLLTKELIINKCLSEGSYLRHGECFNDDLEDWDYETLCTEVVNIDGLMLVYVIQNRQTVDMCKLAVKQNKEATKYVNFSMFNINEIFDDYIVTKEVIQYKIVQVDDVVKIPKIVYIDLSENKSVYINKANSMEDTVNDYVKLLEVVNNDKIYKGFVIKKVNDQTFDLYKKNILKINTGIFMNNYVDKEELVLVGKFVEPNNM